MILPVPPLSIPQRFFMAKAAPLVGPMAIPPAGSGWTGQRSPMPATAILPAASTETHLRRPQLFMTSPSSSMPTDPRTTPEVENRDTASPSFAPPSWRCSHVGKSLAEWGCAEEQLKRKLEYEK